jgi:hypothetical protein
MTLTDVLLAMNAFFPVVSATERLHDRHARPFGYLLPIIFSLVFGAIVVVIQYKTLAWIVAGMNRR